jgi:HK97 family phage portal protein
LNPFKAMTAPARKTAEFFNSLFDYGAGSLAGGFYPVAAGGQAKPPINAARADTGRVISPNSALSINAAWACVWLIADTISTLPFALNQREALGLSFGKLAVSNPLYSILAVTPNAEMTPSDFWQFMVASDLLWGNGYALITRNVNGDVINLEPLRPEYMVPYRQLIYGTEPKQYVIRYRYYSPIESIDFGSEVIFHLKGKTMDGLVGLSPIQYARNSLGIAVAAEEATSDVFRNGLRSGGFITSEKWLKKENRDQFQESLKAFTTGGPRSAGFMTLEGGMSFKPLTMNPQDVQLLASRQFAVEDVCRWFGVLPVLIGHAASGVTAWGSGIEQLLLGWLSLNLRPYVRRIEQTCNRSLIQPKDRSILYTTIDTDDLMGADSAARAALYSTFGQNGIMTRNEMRAREDLPPMDGGDVLTVQSNLIPIDKLGEMGGQPTQLPGQPPPAPGGKPKLIELEARIGALERSSENPPPPRKILEYIV